MRKSNLVIVAAALLAACAGPMTTTTTKVAVPVECRVEVPAEPVYPADTLTGAEDIFTIVKTLWADRKARQAYALQLKTALAGCTAPLTPAPAK